jgi:dienelactone hydrolase
MKTIFLFCLTVAGAATASAKIVTQAVAYEHAGVKLEGYLAYDDAKVSVEKPAPGVAIVPEWWGLTGYAKSRAEQLAKLGYVAFAIDMYGAGVTTEDPKKATELSSQFYGKPLRAERARAGLDQLLATKLVDPKRVAAIGYCFGGAVSQALAYSGAPLAGIVSFHGSLIPATPETAAANKAKFLICQGGADPFVTREQTVEFVKSLESTKIDYEFVIYAGAVHAFTNPGADALAKTSGLTGIGYSASADQRSWLHMRTFFNEIFAVNKS